MVVLVTDGASTSPVHNSLVTRGRWRAANAHVLMDTRLGRAACLGGAGRPAVVHDAHRERESSARVGPEHGRYLNRLRMGVKHAMWGIGMQRDARLRLADEEATAEAMMRQQFRSSIQRATKSFAPRLARAATEATDRAWGIAVSLAPDASPS